MCVVEGLVETRGRGVAGHLACVVSGAVLACDLSPHHAGGTEFGQLHEVVRRHAHVELDAGGHLVGADAGLGEQCHPLCAPCQGVAEFLEYICACVVERIGINREYLEGRHILYGLDKGLCSLGDGGGIDLLAVAERGLERIVVDRAAECLLCAFLLQHLNERFGQVEGAFGASGEVYFHSGEVDAVKQGGHDLFSGFLDGETERVHPFFKHLTSFGVGLGGVGVENLLTGKPVVVVACAADVGVFAGERVQGLEVLDVLAHVHRLNIESFVCAPYEFFLERHAFEVSVDLCPPCVVVDGRELGKQLLFFIICHDNLLCLVVSSWSETRRCRGSYWVNLVCKYTKSINYAKITPEKSRLSSEFSGVN